MCNDCHNTDFACETENMFLKHATITSLRICMNSNIGEGKHDFLWNKNLNATQPLLSFTAQPEQSVLFETEQTK